MTATPHDANGSNRLQAEKLVIEKAMREAVGEAILTHKRLGLPMVEWQDGQIVLCPPTSLTLTTPSNRAARAASSDCLPKPLRHPALANPDRPANSVSAVPGTGFPSCFNR